MASEKASYFELTAMLGIKSGDKGTLLPVRCFDGKRWCLVPGVRPTEGLVCVRVSSTARERTSKL